MDSAHAYTLHTSTPLADEGLADAPLADFSSCGLHLVRETGVDTDADLLHAVSRRAVGSLEALYAALGPRLQAMAMRLLGNGEDACEAVQDTIVRIWEKADEYDPKRSRAFSWMAMLLRGLCLDILRKRRLRAPVWQDWGHISVGDETLLVAHGAALHALASPGDDFLTAQVLEEIRQAFDCLPLGDQRLLLASLFTPDELTDIAKAFGQPVGTVKSRIHRSMQKLRTLLRWKNES